MSVTAVAEPLGAPGAAALADAFPDLVRDFKLHYVADLTTDEPRRLSDHHRRRLRKLPAELRAERIDPPSAALDDWGSVYAGLIRRHDIRGIATFSRESFAAQLAVPGCVAWRAALAGETVGMALWYRDGEDAWYHLGASSDRGYEVGSAYAIFRAALADLAASGVRRADLGGAAGIADDPSDGLARFKRGWSTSTVVARLCGRILDRDAYDRLSRARGAGPGEYFPAYRSPLPAAPPKE